MFTSFSFKFYIFSTRSSRMHHLSLLPKNLLSLPSSSLCFLAISMNSQTHQHKFPLSNALSQCRWLIVSHFLQADLANLHPTNSQTNNQPVTRYFASLHFSREWKPFHLFKSHLLPNITAFVGTWDPINSHFFIDFLRLSSIPLLQSQLLSYRNLPHL